MNGSAMVVPNFHSRIRARTNAYDDGVKVQVKEQLIDVERAILQEFNSYFAPPAQYHFSHGNLDTLKLESAKYLISVFKNILINSRIARKQPQVTRTKISNWILPNVFDNDPVDMELLPVGFQWPNEELDPFRYCFNFDFHSFIPLA